MWTSSLLKKNGWNLAKNNYSLSLGVCFFTIVLFIVLSAVLIGILSFILSFFLSAGSTVEINRNDLIYLLSIMMVPISGVLIQGIFGILETGKNKYFYKSRFGIVNFEYVFWPFENERYKNIMKIMVCRHIIIFLFSMLFYIPGFIKMYETILVPYLMSENPNLTWKRASAISKATMKGEKMKCFFLQLSFIGWFILGCMVFYVGIFAVLPYFESTMAEFYACMRAKMIAAGITTEEELTERSYPIYSQDAMRNPDNPYYQDYDIYQ